MKSKISILAFFNCEFGPIGKKKCNGEKGPRPLWSTLESFVAGPIVEKKRWRREGRKVIKGMSRLDLNN